MAQADPVIHHSSLCQVAVHDGVKLDLAIYKDWSTPETVGQK